jgi:hypothetical protein
LFISNIRREKKLIDKMLASLHASLLFRKKKERKTIACEILELDDDPLR